MAESAQHAIQVELRDNVAQIGAVIQANAQTRVPLRQLAQRLVGEIQAGKPRPDIAVANQAATYVEDATLARITAAYAQQRDAITAQSMALFDGPRFVAAVADARMNDVDPREFVRVLEQALAANDTVINALTALRITLSRALPAERAASAPAG